MATLAKLAVELSLIDNLSGKLQTAANKVASVGQSLNSMGQTLTTRVTLPLVALGVVGVKAASDLNEAMSAANTTFGKSAGTIQQWSKSSATALGMSQAQALTAATQFGALAKNLGQTDEQAAKFSTTLVGAAADLSSFYNVPGSQALADLRSGIVGQYEPLLKYGIVLNEASVKQRAMAMTGKTAADQLTQGELVAARYALIMEKLGPAAGDFARTSDSMANSLRIAQAQFTNAAATLGTLLLPYATQAIQRFAELAERFQGLSPTTQKIVVAIAAFAAALGPALIVVGQMAMALPALVTAFTLLTGPIGLVVAAIAGLGIAYATNFLGFRDGVNAGLAAVGAAFQAVVPYLEAFKNYLVAVVTDGDTLNDWLTHIPPALQPVVFQIGEFTNALMAFAPAVQKAGDFLKAAFEASLPFITIGLQTAAALVVNFATTVLGVFTGLLRSLTGILQVLKGVFTGDFGLIKEGVTNIVGGLKDAVVALIRGLLGQIKIQLDATKTVFIQVWNDVWANVVTIVANLVSSVVSYITGLASSVFNAAFNAGYNLGQGIIGGIAAIWDSVVGYAESLVHAVIDKLKDIPGFSPIEHVGQFYGEKLGMGFAEGIASATDISGRAASGLVGGAMGGMTTMGNLTFNISGAGDPRSVADAVWATFARELTLREGV